MTTTAWTPASVTSTRYGATSGIYYNEADRTYNATEQSTSSGKRYYNGLTPAELNQLGTTPTAFTKATTTATAWQ